MSKVDRSINPDRLIDYASPITVKRLSITHDRRFLDA